MRAVCGVVAMASVDIGQRCARHRRDDHGEHDRRERHQRILIRDRAFEMVITRRWPRSAYPRFPPARPCRHRREQVWAPIMTRRGCRRNDQCPSQYGAGRRNIVLLSGSRWPIGGERDDHQRHQHGPDHEGTFAQQAPDEADEWHALRQAVYAQD